jgi:antitoxin (DNA-binding transcriptional repressor) of toxin-antitoxin stability system
MTEVNITELRRQLPAYLARAASGERMRVTCRGRVVAELGPPTRSAQHAGQARARLAGSVLRFDAPFEPVLEPSRWGEGR